jgi:hypothetical protein
LRLTDSSDNDQYIPTFESQLLRAIGGDFPSELENRQVFRNQYKLSAGCNALFAVPPSFEFTGDLGTIIVTAPGLDSVRIDGA